MGGKIDKAQPLRARMAPAASQAVEDDAKKGDAEAGDDAAAGICLGECDVNLLAEVTRVPTSE